MTSDTELPNKTAITIAFGRWLLRQAEREIEQKFARLRAIPDHLPVKILELIDLWPTEDQSSMLSAQIKRFLNPRPTHPGVPLFELTTRENWALQQFDFVLAQSPALRENTARRVRGDFSLPKGALKRAVKAKLKTLLGPPESDSGGEVRYVTHIAGTTVYTDLDFGSRGCQLRYDQNVLPGECTGSIGYASELFLLRAVSLLNLAGHGSTKWSFLTPDGIPSAADLLGELSIEFIEAVPRIVEEARTAMM